MNYSLSLIFFFWSEFLFKKMVYNGIYVDKVLVVQGVLVYIVQDVYRFIDFIIVNVLEDDVYQVQLFSREDICYKKCKIK